MIEPDIFAKENSRMFAGWSPINTEGTEIFTEGAESLSGRKAQTSMRILCDGGKTWLFYEPNDLVICIETDPSAVRYV
ncbi:hypothetical protein [Daejeonella sp.]|uniref:hypothetical protein n=1 Tax=Daejeonella sp. TaxID=2805397 RepID=UPI0030C3E4E9